MGSSFVKRLLTFCLAIGLLAPLPVRADVQLIYETQGLDLFQFAVPDGWEINPGFEVPPSAANDDKDPAPRVVSILPKETDLVMWTGLWSPTDVHKLDEAPDYIRNVAPRLLSDVQITFREDRQINGMSGRVASGTGERDGRDFDFALVAIQISSDRLAFAAFIGQPEAYDQHEQALIGVMNSIRPAGGGQ